MAKASVSERYFKVLRGYVASRGEAYLLAAAGLGRELVRQGVPPEEIAEMHENALWRLAEEAPGKTLLESVRLISAPLMELLMSYGLAFRELLDIRERAEKHNKRLATAIEQTGESVIITNTDGVIQYVNPALERISGYSSAEVRGKTPRIFKSGKHDKDFYAHLWQTITMGRIWKGRLVNRRKNGSLYHLDCTISPVKDLDGKITNYVAVRREITQQIELEKQLRQSQKMEAIGTLAGGIAHDFNNILSSVFGFTELALAEVMPGTRLHDHLQEVLAAGNRAKNLVSQILTFSRRSEVEQKPVEVRLIAKETLKFLRASLPTTIEIRRHIESRALVLGDPTQIHQVIMNLCTNAGHAVREGGGILEVTLRNVQLKVGKAQQLIVEPGEFKSRIEYLDLGPGPYLMLTVADTGHGIPPDIVESIFDPYFTTKNKGESTGLGLSVVHGIVTSLGGAITVESEPGKGTTFTVLLPAIEREAEEAFLEEKGLAGGSERILFIDDEPSLVKMGRLILESLGYKVETRTSSLEALELFKARPDRFDLVITDMTMPHMTGDILANELMQVRPGIPVILCTGYSEKISKERAEALGINGFLMKPVVKADLAQMIRQVLDG